MISEFLLNVYRRLPDENRRVKWCWIESKRYHPKYERSRVLYRVRVGDNPKEYPAGVLLDTHSYWQARKARNQYIAKRKQGSVKHGASSIK